MDANYHKELIPNLYEGVYVVDQSRKIIFWNQGSERITGYKATEVVNQYCYQNLLQHIDEQGKQLCLDGCPLHHTLNTGKINEAHVFLKHKDGYRIPVMVKSLPIYDSDNHIVAAIEVFTDERFQRDVYHENVELKDKLTKDPLTKIANRHYFDYTIAKAVEEANLFNKPFGVLFMDIDKFKTVNDTYGHLVGDEILKVVAQSLTTNIERNDLISRWGGEEFVGVLAVDSTDDLLKVAERLRHIVGQSSYKIDAQTTVSVTISIGGTMYIKGEQTETMMKRADQHVYFAKQHGRNQSKVE